MSRWFVLTRRNLGVSARAYRQQLQYFGQRTKSSGDGAFKPQTKLLIFGATVGLGGLYYATHLETVYLTGRRQFVAISPDEEQALGDESYKQVRACVDFEQTQCSNGRFDKS